jgi:small-conductance mechanosensitive channel
MDPRHSTGEQRLIERERWKGHLSALLLATGATLVGFASIHTHLVRAQSSAQPVKQTPAKTQAIPPALQPKPIQVQIGDDAADRAKAVIAHLNSVLRFYRDTQSPIQKVGEPSDLVYRDQAVTLAREIGGYAFQSAKAEAALIDGQPSAPAGGQAQRLQQTRATIDQRISDLKAQQTDLAKQIASAPAKKQAALKEQQQEIAGQLQLQTAMSDALGKIIGMADASNSTGFASQVSQLERSAPGLTSSQAVAAPPTLDSLSAARSAGVSSQAKVLFQLLSTREAIDDLIQQVAGLHNQALALRTPLISMLRSTIAQGQAMAQNEPAPAPASSSPEKSAAVQTPPSASIQVPTQATFLALTERFKAISGASVPLSQESLALEQAQASLQAWRATVNDEYLSILRWLVLRIIFIAIALLAILALGEAWSRTTRRYVKDARRRRQLMVIRRLLTGFLTGLVLIFGLVTQFSSLATFAGFLTAGIALGLQTILLSVAAYFFIIGRYGIKVGDRITISGVTGDVAEVGIVRFYMMEMAGSGTDLYPTGRVAVFSNAVLFQAGTPLYKQMPGTHYAWHELTVKLAPDADYQTAAKQMHDTMQSVYQQYSDQLERQHKTLEVWMDAGLDTPGVFSSIQFIDGGLQFWARFPVVLRQSAVTDEQMTQALAKLIAGDEKVKAAVSAPPVIKAAIKG